MKFPVYILFAIALVACNSKTSKTSQTKPSYVEIVNYFFNNYSVNDIQDNKEIAFEKHLSSWKIKYIDPQNRNNTSTETIWDTQNSYSDLSITKKKGNNVNSNFMDGLYKNRLLDKNTVSKFEIFKCFGYDRWAYDIIDNFDSTQAVSNNKLLGTAQAYSNIAFQITSRNTQTKDKKSLDTIIEFHHKAFQLYNQLYKQNPSFIYENKTIKLMASNEMVKAYSSLLLQNKEASEELLNEAEYSDFILSSAKMQLQSCPENAILFTSHPDIYCPIVYAQEKEKIRKDVKIILSSILVDTAYFNSLREDGIKLQLDKNFTQNTSPVFKPVKEDKAVELSVALNKLTNGKDELTSKISSFPFDIYIKNNKGDSISITLPKEYVYINQVFAFDIINSNISTRPICFTTESSLPKSLGISKYLQYNGIVKELVFDSDMYSTKINYKLLVEDIDWNSETVDYKNYHAVYSYRKAVNQLASQLISQNDTEKANRAIDKCIKDFPDSICTFGYTTALLVGNYYKTGNFEQGNKIARIILKNSKNNCLLTSPLYSQNKSTKKHTINLLKKLSTEFKQQEILDIANSSN